MSTVRKYAGLPDLDPDPDIYETPELTDDNSTHPTSTTLRSESPASSYQDGEDDTSGIDRHPLDTDEARTHFLPTDQRHASTTGRISSKRKSYRSSSRKRRRDTPEINGIINRLELSSDEEEESLERKLARLRREVAEVKDEFEQRKGKPRDDEAQETTENATTLNTLEQVLISVDATNTNGETGAASRLKRRLASISRQSGQAPDRTPAEGRQQNSSSSTYTVTYAPRYKEDHALSKVSDFDSRLALIEAALGIDAIPLPTQDESTTKAIIPTLNILDKKFTTLSTTTDSSLDTLGRRVRQLTHDTEKLEQARKSAKAALEALRQETLSPTGKDGRSPLADTGAKLSETEDPESVAKINALYGTLSTIESLAPLLPSVLDRLRSLRTLHANAATASQSLAKIESRQDAMQEELQGWREGLEKVEKAMQQGEQTMKGNTELVEVWVKELEERMQPGADHFSNLADEIVLQIFRHLAQRDLATLRNLCHPFARCGRDLLYTEITLSPTERSVNAFLYVTKHPDFHQHVRHFTYDDTQLIRFFTYHGRFAKALQASYIPTGIRRGEAFAQYCGLFREQQQILDGLSNLLLEGLPRLSELEKVSIVGGPSRSPNCSFKGGATVNGVASTGLGLPYWSYQDKVKYHFMESKGFHDLIKALNQAEVRVRELHIGNWSEEEYRAPLKMGLPFSSLSLRDATGNAVFNASATREFANVTNLNLQIDGQARTLGHEYTVRNLEILFNLLSAMHHLSRLSLGFTHLVWHARLTKRLVKGMEPHALVYLRLRSVRLYVDVMVRLFEQHHATLTELCLVNVDLPGRTTANWRTLVQNVGWFANTKLGIFRKCFDQRRSS